MTGSMGNWRHVIREQDVRQKSQTLILSLHRDVSLGISSQTEFIMGLITYEVDGIAMSLRDKLLAQSVCVIYSWPCLFSYRIDAPGEQKIEHAALQPLALICQLSRDDKR